MSWDNPNNSTLVLALQQAVEQAGALGIMVRFTGYVNVYFMNGILNNIQAQVRDYPSLASALAAAWDLWNQSGDPHSSSRIPVTATLSAWSEFGMTASLASVPGGRCLAADASVTPFGLSGVKSNPSPRPSAVVVMGHELKSTAVKRGWRPGSAGTGRGQR